MRYNQRKKDVEASKLVLISNDYKQEKTCRFLAFKKSFAFEFFCK